MKINVSGLKNFVSPSEIQQWSSQVAQAHQTLTQRTGEGSNFLGWIDLPEQITEELLADIEAQAQKIKEKAQIYVVIGIGGSYLGARAVIEALQNNFASLQERKAPSIVYAGNSLNEDYLADLLDLLDHKDYCLTVISKSGTTTEPAIAFRILKNHIERKYGKKEARERIIAITDKEKGALKTLANQEGYNTYVVPDDIGGRYSVLTPVGLLPIAVAGFDIKKLVSGANDMRSIVLANKNFANNPAWQYAVYRNILRSQGKQVELMVSYTPSLTYFSEWFKQLYGESEGKDSKGLFPASVCFTTDLHSMGQFIQEGTKLLFETTIHVAQSHNSVTIPFDEKDTDGLNYLLSNTLTDINQKAEEGTFMAHIDGGVPQIKIEINSINEISLGQMIYFFEFACGLSAYMLGVNPFNQPGVEKYKRNMFLLLGKPGVKK